MALIEERTIDFAVLDFNLGDETSAVIAHALIARQVPFAFATGYGSSGTAHTTDEYVKIDNLYHGSRLLESFLKKYDPL